MKLKMDNKEFLIKTKKKLSTGFEFFIYNYGILNPIKSKKFEFSDFKINVRF